MDKLGICTSFLCIVHCISLPILYVFGLESMLLIVDQEWMEITILLLSFIIGGISFIAGFRKHHQHFVPVLFVAGYLLIVNGESVSHSWLALILSISGALVIAYAHYHNLNLRIKASIR